VTHNVWLPSALQNIKPGYDMKSVFSPSRKSVIGRSGWHLQCRNRLPVGPIQVFSRPRRATFGWSHAPAARPDQTGQGSADLIDGAHFGKGYQFNNVTKPTAGTNNAHVVFRFCQHKFDGFSFCLALSPLMPLTMITSATVRGGIILSSLFWCSRAELMISNCFFITVHMVSALPSLWQKNHLPLDCRGILTISIDVIDAN
jgi:hypothetical protein